MPVTVQSPMTINDYCAAMNRREILINPIYQRSDKVWPPAARSFLIESIVLGYPIPKLFLFQQTDLKSKKTIKEIVDGQQRSKAIHDFFSNDLRISTRSKIAALGGKTYEQLGDEFKGAFLNYQLSVDLFVSASAREIREAFRRLNSYTVPLNPEEKRHAEYQGEFKWFANDLSEEYEEAFLEMGVFGQKQIVRMQDTKLITEAIHALLNGIRTTKSKQLDDVYAELDEAFPQKKALRSRLVKALDWLVMQVELHKGALMAPHVFYTLMLAVTHVQRPVDAFQEPFPFGKGIDIDAERALANLTRLSEALTAEVPAKKLKSFAEAASQKTNVEDQRKRRFVWLCKALTAETL